MPPVTGLLALPGRLRTALGIAIIGAIALASGPLLPLVSPATPAGFHAAPLLLATGVLPVLVALGFALRGRALATGGALLVAAVFAPGRALADAQVSVDASQATRPDLVVSHSLTALHGSTGLWLLLLGHLLTLVAGGLAVGYGGLSEQHDGEVVAPRPGSRQGPTILGLALGLFVAICLLAAPFTSDDPFLLAHDVLDQGAWQMAGGLLIAIAVPVVSTLTMTAIEPVAVRGWLFGAAAVVVAVALPNLVAGLAVPGLHPQPGPYLAVLGAGALVAVGLPARQRTGAEGIVAGPDPEPAELSLPGQRRLHRAAGIAALVAAVAAVLGGTTDLYVLPAGLNPTTDFAGRPLIPAALLVGVLGAALLVPRWAATVRPALAVGCAVVPLAGLSATDTALTATRLNGVGVGFGTWATVVAIVAALVSACCAGVAGGVERDDVDLSELHLQVGALGPIAVAILLAIGAFGLPVLRASGYVEPTLWSHFEVESWGLLIGLLAVLGAAMLAPLCRPRRGAALLLGAAGVLLVRALELPLTGARAAGSTAGPGAWLALAAAVAAVVGAGWLGTAGRRAATNGLPSRKG